MFHKVTDTRDGGGYRIKCLLFKLVAKEFAVAHGDIKNIYFSTTKQSRLINRLNYFFKPEFFGDSDKINHRQHVKIDEDASFSPGHLLGDSGSKYPSHLMVRAVLQLSNLIFQ